MGYFLTGGGFQDSTGSPLAKGWLTAELTAPGLDTTDTIGICNGEQIEFLLDSSGNITTLPAQYIWPTDLIDNFSNYTFQYYYRFTAYAQTGELAWGPNYLPVVSVSATDFVQSEQFVGNGAQQVYTTSAVPVANSLFVYYNGVLESNYNLSGNTITFTFVPQSGSNIDIVYYLDQNVAPVFRQETPIFVQALTYRLTATPIASSLLLYRASIDLGGLLQTLDVDYILNGNVITLTEALDGQLFATYQTSAGFTTSRQVTPSGSINGSNRIFTLPDVALPESLQYFWNGVELTVGVDYQLSSDDMTITMVTTPNVGDYLVAFYNLNAVAIDFSTFVPLNPA